MAPAPDAVPPSPPLPAPKPRPARRSPSPGNTDGVAGGSPQQQAEIQLALAAQAARFDAMMKVLAEQQREIKRLLEIMVREKVDR